MYIAEDLYLDSNKLTSTIPSAVVSLSHLGMPLWYHVYIAILSEYQVLANASLEHLFLHKQMLNGTIPTEFGLATSLSKHPCCLTRLQRASITWFAHIFAFLSLPRDTAEVALFDNMLSGTVPTELSGLPLLGMSCNWWCFLIDLASFMRLTAFCKPPPLSWQRSWSCIKTLSRVPLS
jgi:hypothetical protein